MDKVDDVATSSAGEDYSAGFAEGSSNDPLDFSDVPAAAKEEEEPAAELPEAPEAEAPEAPQAAAPEPQPAPESEIARVYDLIDRRLPKESPLEPALKAQEPAPAPPKPALDDDQKRRYDELRGDWKDVHELLDLHTKMITDQLTQQFQKQLAEVRGEVEQKIQPIQNTVQQSAVEKYDTVFKSAHPEFYDEKLAPKIQDEMVQWLKSQPEYLRNAYIAAANSPDPNDVVDLVNRFKLETGKTQAVTPPPENNQPAAPAAAAKDDKKNERLRQLAQPMSRQTPGADSDDPTDFEGGFREMARQLDRAG